MFGINRLLAEVMQSVLIKAYDRLTRVRSTAKSPVTIDMNLQECFKRVISVSARPICGLTGNQSWRCRIQKEKSFLSQAS